MFLSRSLYLMRHKDLVRSIRTESQSPPKLLCSRLTLCHKSFFVENFRYNLCRINHQLDEFRKKTQNAALHVLITCTNSATERIRFHQKLQLLPLASSLTTVNLLTVVNRDLYRALFNGRPIIYTALNLKFWHRMEIIAVWNMCLVAFCAAQKFNEKTEDSYKT